MTVQELIDKLEALPKDIPVEWVNRDRDGRWDWIDGDYVGLEEDFCGTGHTAVVLGYMPMDPDEVYDRGGWE